jgi:T4 gene Gp59 loader of gp41 DNA helicase
MIEGEGFSAYAIYNAIHLHFTSKYDYFKYNGKTNVSKDSFLKRNDKYKFHKLARKYSLIELRDFFVANFIEKSVGWIGEITGEEGESNYKNWLKRRDSLSYVFEGNLEFLFDHVKKPDELLIVKDGNYPRLLNYWMGNDIYIESVCILNDMLNFMPMWSNKIDDDIVWPNYKLKIEKYSPFIEYNKVRLKTILKGQIDEHFKT